ncbi:DgyrCDS4925 [Dimorphilus gyrociliatus]|uniref:DgyrCDS4925 n=1 Tax=Dimorphilus gyrociliatus TaxID=2664684 RepID=A0A7I8VKL5_9ANNE|nr:DgyrCDS4925 [Dimorphilus gyrociliatus]
MEVIESEDKSFNKHILQEGTGEKLINEGSLVKVYICCIDNPDMDKDLLGNYTLNEYFDVTIGEAESSIAELLDKILITMKEGERAYVKTKMDQSGNLTSKSITHDSLNLKKTESDCLLKFQISVQSVTRSADISDLEADERIERAEHYKEKGSILYKNNNLTFAVKKYRNSIKYLTSIPEESLPKIPEKLRQEFRRLVLLNHLNLALCFWKIEEWDLVLKHCDEALSLDPNNVKALYRRAQGYSNKYNYEAALKDLNSILKIEEGNKAALKDIKIISAKKQQEKDMYKKMFNS